MAHEKGQKRPYNLFAITVIPWHFKNANKNNHVFDM